MIQSRGIEVISRTAVGVACLLVLAAGGSSRWGKTPAQTTNPAPPASSGGSPSAQPGTPANPVLLGPGVRSQEVMILQQQLQNLGYYSDPIDGNYGESTAAGVRRFQQSANLPVTGMLDQITWQQMRTPQLFGAAPTPAAPTPAPTNPEGEAVSPSPTPADPEAPASTGTPGGDEPLAAASTPAVAEEAPEAAEDTDFEVAASEGRSSLWLGLGLLGLLTAVVSLGVAIALWRRLQQAEEELESTPSPLTPNRLGSAQRGAASASASLEAASEAPAPRLTRVNIVEELVAELDCPDPNVRRKAIWELGQRGDSSAIQPLIETLINADSKERSLILAALSEIGTRTLKPMNRALAIALQDPNSEVRKNAIRDLTRTYDIVGQMSQMLGHASQDSDSEVQETARWALEQLSQIRLLSDGSATLSGSPAKPELEGGDE